MPSIKENIIYFLHERVLPIKSSLIYLTRLVCALIGIALIVEVFLFNWNYYASAHLDTIDLKSEINLREDANGMFRFTAVDHELEFFDLNTTVENIHIELDPSQPAQNLTFRIHFTDDAHLTYFDSTEYTVGIPDVEVSTNSWQSQYINLNSSGEMESLKLEIVGDDVIYPIKLKTIELNAHHPFMFSWLRFFGVFGILCLISIFRPGSVVYRIRIVENPRESKAGIIVAVVIECMLVGAFLFYGSNLVGVATQSYNQGEWDGRSVVNTFEVGGDNAQQYAELARSMANGKLYLEEEPPEWLVAMDDPYDKGARDEAQKETGEDYLFDVAYYNGHYYVYFGVVPVLLYYLPFFIATGSNFPTAIGVLISALFFIVGCSALLDRFARYHFKKVNLGLYLLMQIALLSGCGLLYLLKFPTFYSLPIATGLAFSVWGLYFWMRGRSSSSRHLNYVLGSFCMALVVGCRPQLLLLSFLAFPLFWRPYITERRLFTRQGIVDLICLLAPYIVVALGIMWYNYARFGSLTDFGANYNLTVNDMTKRGSNIGRFAPAAFAYFFQLPNVVGVFPFLQPVDFSTTYMGQTIKEATYGGIFACYPVLWILLFTRPITRMRNAQRSTKTITGVIATLLISGFVIALLDAQMAGILERYFADFSFMFFASVVLLVFIVNENLDEVDAVYPTQTRFHFARPRKTLLSSMPNARDMLTKMLIALVSIGVFYSVLLCATPEIGWYSDVYPWAYQDVLETFLFWT